MAKGIKHGGRKKGTPNKCTTTARLAAQLIRMYIIEMYNDYSREQLMKDLMSLSPKDRLNMMKGFLNIATRVNKSGNVDDEILLNLFNQEQDECK